MSELIAQTILKCVYGLNTSDVDVDKLGSHLKDHKDYESILDEYKNKRLCSNDKKTIKIGLFEDFRLLSLLNHESESYLEVNKRFKDLIVKRNTSILAHGLVPIDKSDASDLFSEVLKLVRDKWSELEISPSFDDVTEISFPKQDEAEISTNYSDP